ncbi:MAG: ParB/RepB/Spo0J family partition protein [Planctomycetota bacterium]|nr:ParB/RepB/Spo0J family partition protein [Planctomycetota bacterium]
MNQEPNINKAPDTIKEDAELYEIRPIPIEKIEVAAFCRRDNYVEEDMAQLKLSIEKRGLIQNPVVLDSGEDAFLLIVGSRRFEACKSLGWKTLPCRVKKSVAKEKEQAPFISFSENEVRTIPHPVERARRLQEIKENTGMTDAQIAAEVGLAQSTVTDLRGILEFGDALLSNIGTLPKSPFKVTHAVALLPLKRTNRSNRDLEISQLVLKTIENKLPSSEVKNMVHLLKDGSYDNLPTGLQMLLLKSNRMTAKMAELFLHPETFISDNSHNADVLREEACRLDKGKRRTFVETALVQNWPESEIPKRLIKLLKPSNSEPKKQNAAEIMISEISLLTNKLEDGRYQLATFKPSDIDKLCRKSRQLIQTVTSLLNTATEIIKEAQNKNYAEKIEGETL